MEYVYKECMISNWIVFYTTFQKTKNGVVSVLYSNSSFTIQQYDYTVTNSDVTGIGAIVFEGIVSC